MKSFKDAGLRWVENTPKELEAATLEMLDRNNGSRRLVIPDNDLQRRFKAMAEVCGLKHGGRPVKAFAHISRDIINRNTDIFP